MKHLLLSVFAIVLVLTSCNSNGVNRELQEKDSLQLIVDSIHSKDIKLTFKGLTVGDSLKPSDKGLYGDGIHLTAIDEYSYQGNVNISFIDSDGHERTEYPKIQVDVLNGVIVKVGLLTDSWGLCKFFIDTFNDRYYEEEPRTSNRVGSYNDHYGWFFKEQNICINRLYHIDPESGIYHITDAALIEYEHTELGKRLDNIIASLDSLKKEEKGKLTEQEKKRLRDNI